ncbi:MAG: hypothetical protein K0R41_2242, partial [Geminicoccaceae bacterium]|nr:hypothetical protein [Geminicoccaceae bacterium]
DVGTIKARIWDSHVDVSRISGLWWAEADCMIMPYGGSAADADNPSASQSEPKGGKA